MTPEEESQVISEMASDIMNRLTLHGLIESAKFFSVEQARHHYEQLSEEEKQGLFDEIKKSHQESPQTAPLTSETPE